MFALNRLRDIHATIAVLVTLAVTMLFHQSVQAKTTITLQDNFAISFSSGQLDSRSYQGEIFDVELSQDGEVVATADRVLLMADDTYDEPNYFVQQFEIDNLNAIEDEIFITAQTIRMTDLYLGWLLSDEELSHGRPIDWRLVTYKLGNIEVMDENAGYAISVPHLESTPLDFGQLPNGERFLASVGIKMPFMQIRPIGDSENAREFKAWLSAAGIPNLELAFSTRQQNIIQGTDILSDSQVQVKLAGLFDFLLRSEFYTSQEAYLTLSDPTMWTNSEDDYLSYLAANTKLGRLKIDMRDLGLLDFIEQTGEIPPYPILAEQLQSIMTSFLPETGPELARAIGSFMMDSGALHISATPSEPFRVEDLAVALFMPDFVVRQINLKVIHTP